MKSVPPMYEDEKVRGWRCHERNGMRRGAAGFVIFLLFQTIMPSSSFAATMESLGDAAIAHDLQSGTWTIAAGGAALSVTFTRSRDYQITSFVSPSGTDWIRAAGPDTI